MFKTNKLLLRLYLFILKRRIKKYKKYAKWYERQNYYSNFYHEKCIPDLENEILKIESELNYNKISLKP